MVQFNNKAGVPTVMVWLAVALVVVVGLAKGESENDWQEGPAFAEPASVTSSNGVLDIAIEVVEHRVEVAGVMAWTTRVYATNGVPAMPAATWSISPGDRVTVTLTNNLVAAELDAEENMTHNTLHSPNIVNIHTHGLHIDPHVDTVFKHVQPGGEQLVYNYEIPEGHPPGLHWMHDHTHGSSAYHIMGGLLGAVMVNRDPSVDTDWPADLEAAMDNSVVVVITHVKFKQDLSGDGVTPSQGCSNDLAGDFSPFRVYSYAELGEELQDNIAHEATWEAGAEGLTDIYLVNGQYQPVLEMEVGEVKVLRVLIAMGGYQPQLGVRPRPGSNGDCTAKILATDGIFLPDAPRDLPDRFRVVQAGRVDLAVQCTGTGDFTVESSEASLRQNYLTLRVGAASSDKANMAMPASMAAVDRPSYLDDLRGLADGELSKWGVHMSQGGRDVSTCGFWMGMGSACEDVDEPSTDSAICPFERFRGERNCCAETGHAYAMDLDDPQEWAIVGLGGDYHPLHIHTNFFQVVSWEPTNPNDADLYKNFFEFGDWRDTVPAMPGVLKIRFVPTDFDGEIVVHCHFLRHEDLGMMGSVYVRPRAETAVDGGWSDFTYTDCSSTCTGGTRSGTRTCTNPAPSNGGAECQGSATTQEQCNAQVECTGAAVDGGWSDYTYTDCSSTCTGGTRNGTRTCNNPAPSNGGADCQGSATMQEQCNAQVACAVDGGWSDYTYSECSSTCTGGTRTGTRTCTNPAPANGGAECQGSATAQEQCNEQVACALPTASIVIESSVASVESLRSDIEAALSTALGYTVTVEEIVAANAPGTADDVLEAAEVRFSAMSDGAAVTATNLALAWSINASAFANAVPAITATIWLGGWGACGDAVTTCTSANACDSILTSLQTSCSAEVASGLLDSCSAGCVSAVAELKVVAADILTCSCDGTSCGSLKNLSANGCTKGNAAVLLRASAGRALLAAAVAAVAAPLLF